MRHLLMIMVLWTQGYLLTPELARLPGLFAHFIEHRHEAGDMDLLRFLALHYNDESHDATAPHEHDSLPFHHHHGAAVDHCSMKLITTDAAPPVSFPDDLVVREPGLLPKDHPLSGFRSTLLQPPRQRA